MKVLYSDTGRWFWETTSGSSHALKTHVQSWGHRPSGRVQHVHALGLSLDTTHTSKHDSSFLRSSSLCRFRVTGSITLIQETFVQVSQKCLCSAAESNSWHTFFHFAPGRWSATSSYLGFDIKHHKNQVNRMLKAVTKDWCAHHSSPLVYQGTAASGVINCT